jgi:hypothetical protein
MADNLCFIPCCKIKTPTIPWNVPDQSLTQWLLPKTWHDLETGRAAVKDRIDLTCRKVPALQLFNGIFYQCDLHFRKRIRDAIQSNQISAFIISGGYGLVHAFEPIHQYDSVMVGKTAESWKNAGLVYVIEELICNLKPKRVFGFFAGPPDWCGSHAKYRYFFTEGTKAAKTLTTSIETAECFYRSKGKGVGAIMGALGRALLHGIEEGFSKQFVDGYRSGRKDNSVTITSMALL